MKSIILAASLCGIVSLLFADNKEPVIDPPVPMITSADVGETLSWMSDGTLQTNRFKRVSANAGVKAILERRTMKAATVQPIRQITQDGSILSLYADGSITTQAVRVIRMTETTKAAVAAKLEDEALLASAKELAARIKTTHAAKVKGLSDSDVLASAESVFDSSTSSATKAIVAALLAAGAVAATTKTKKTK